jgi:hypothetical protein
MTQSGRRVKRGVEDTIMADDIRDDNVQHGIDDNPTGDAKKGGILGAVGGAVVGALAGGPVGAVIGAVAGGVGSAAGVAAVDRVDNDNTVTGIGGNHAATRDIDESLERDDNTVYTNASGHNVSTPAYNTTGAAGSYAAAGTTGMNNDPDGNLGVNRREELGETTPSIKTGGTALDGTPDTRGVGEKFVDTLTGDKIDDKTHKRVD